MLKLIDQRTVDCTAPEKPRPYKNPPRLPEGAVDLGAWLPGDGPLEIDIGPGRGLFLIERATAVPSARLLGIEIRRKWAILVEARLAKLGFGERARLVCEDARLALPRLLPEGAVARVFLHFPDPWWKKRHQKRSLIGPALCDQIARLLADDGELFVQTDVGERAERFEHLLARPQFEPAGDAPGTARTALNPYGAKSNRERRADNDGLPVSRLRYRRRPR